MSECEGPMIWFSVGVPDEYAGILECSKCDYIIVTGNWNRTDHAFTPVMREGV